MEQEKTPALHIRPLLLPDIEKCVTLFMDTFSRPPWNERYESREEVRKYFSNFLGLDNFLGFVGTIGENLAALCVGMRKPWLKRTEYYIDQFCVAHACQRKGIGSLFLHEIEKQLTDREIKGILLNTERNYPAHDFYRKNGFTILEGLVVMGKE